MTNPGGVGMAKYWGDERHSDAVYAVYLRKVRYVPPHGYEGMPRYRVIDPDKEREGMGADHLQWESIKERHIKAGTLDKLIECLIGSDNVMDSRHFNVFFATYRAFAKPEEVLERLISRYSILEEDANGSTSALVMQNSIRSVLTCWLDMYSEDFYSEEDDFSTLSRLMEFASIHKLVDLRSKARKLKEQFKCIKSDGGVMAHVSSLDQLACAYGFECPDMVENAAERARMFDVNRENCVQIAEQLTYWDATLFKELIIHQCQGYTWSRRHKLSPERSHTVKATIDQFNAVCQRVMTSVVLPDCRPEFRARIITKWIDIARELRALKNFSSLKAVLSSLQSEAVYRLKTVWALVSSRSLAQFRELSSMFDGNEEGKILDQEGTAKHSPLKRPQLIQNCRRTKSDLNLAECQGTVPWLGPFLKELTTIEEAHPDFTEDGLINFEKRQKEFDVLAKIRLFQSAARAYRIPMDRAFCAWFYYLPTMSDTDCFSRSLEVERRPQSSTPDIHENGNMSKSSTLARLLNSSRHEDSFLSRTLIGQTSRDSGIHSDDCVDGGSRPISHSLTAPNTPINTVGKQRSRFYPPISSEFSPLEVFASESLDGRHLSSPSMAPSDMSKKSHMTHGSDGSSSGSTSSRNSCQTLPPPPPASYILARVGLDDTLQGADTGANNYKCIKVENGERLNGLVGRVLEKHLLDGDPNDFDLVQLLPDGGELKLPGYANPFYAFAPDPSSPMVNLILRRRAIGPSAKKINKLKMSHLLRWSSESRL